jgi:hypothetical protein
MVETEKLPEGQRAWPIPPFKRYSRVRRRISQQPCTSRMVVSLGLCLLDCALGSAAGEWQSVDGYRFKELTVSTNEPVGFTSLPPDSTGIDFVNRLGKEQHTTNQIYLNGAGVAAGDYDGQGSFHATRPLNPKGKTRLGSGYCSQDGLVQLFVVGDSKAKLHIRWDDSSIATVPVPARAKGIVISQTDGVKDVH